LDTCKIERCIEALHALNGLCHSYQRIREALPIVKLVEDRLRMVLTAQQTEQFLMDISKAIWDVTLKYQPLIEANLKEAAK
jgi:hypothetical protein